METSTRKILTVLLEQEGLEPRDGDLERFASLVERYLHTLKTLRSVDVGDEEIAGTFHPGSK